MNHQHHHHHHQHIIIITIITNIIIISIIIIMIMNHQHHHHHQHIIIIITIIININIIISIIIVVIVIVIIIIILFFQKDTQHISAKPLPTARSWHVQLAYPGNCWWPCWRAVLPTDTWHQKQSLRPSQYHPKWCWMEPLIQQLRCSQSLETARPKRSKIRCQQDGFTWSDSGMNNCQEFYSKKFSHSFSNDFSLTFIWEAHEMDVKWFQIRICHPILGHTPTAGAGSSVWTRLGLCDVGHPSRHHLCLWS